MDYVNHTWRLPKVGSPVLSMPCCQNLYLLGLYLPKTSLTLSSRLIFQHATVSRLFPKTSTGTEAYVPTFLSNERVEGRLQQRFENMCQLRKEAVTLHRAHGHPNNQTLLLNLEAHSIPHTHLKRYILAVSCDACHAATGKRNNKTSAVTVTKRQNIAEQKKVAKVQRKLFANRMQPAFAGSYRTVAIPFGSRVPGYLPREHPWVKN